MEELLQYEREKLLYLLRLTGIIRRYKIGPGRIDQILLRRCLSGHHGTF